MHSLSTALQSSTVVPVLVQLTLRVSSLSSKFVVFLGCMEFGANGQFGDRDIMCIAGVNTATKKAIDKQ